MKHEKSSALAKRYQTVLRRYLKQGPSASLLPAVRLGRQAVVFGLETLDLAVFHEQALIAQVLKVHITVSPERELKLAG